MSDQDWTALGRRWWSHVQVLADDRMEGRGTGSRGYGRAADYVEERFRGAGLQPAGTHGFRQPVEFRESKVDRAHTTIELVREGKVEPIVLGDHAAILVNQETPESFGAEAVFIGYGLSVPEAGHDDLAGEDLKGKVAVLIRGGPTNLPGPIKAHGQSPEERAKALRAAGAAGVISIMNPTVEDLPWPRLSSGVMEARLELADPGPDGYHPLPFVVLWNHERAEVLFAGSGHTFKEAAAGIGSDRPLPHFPLAVRVRARIKVKRQEVRCQNLVGVLPGADPKLKDEYVVVSAHLDHLGIGPPVNGDSIYSGAMDNASGVAGLLHVAQQMKEGGTKPRRSVLFLAVTAEEKGLLGSEYFAGHPTVQGPIVANLNLDGLLPLCPFKHMEVQGLAESSLGDDIRVVCAQTGVQAHPEYEPDRVLFIRSDQYSFIRRGVPALFPMYGYLQGSDDERLFRAWTKDRYHAPSDDLDQPVDFAGAALFNHVMDEMVRRIANADTRPVWKPDSFFRRFAK
jgi:Zn-dependent M28 family amino/carboxypeptidase